MKVYCFTVEIDIPAKTHDAAYDELLRTLNNDTAATRMHVEFLEACDPDDPTVDPNRDTTQPAKHT